PAGGAGDGGRVIEEAAKETSSRGEGHRESEERESDADDAWTRAQVEDHARVLAEQSGDRADRGREDRDALEAIAQEDRSGRRDREHRRDEHHAEDLDADDDDDREEDEEHAVDGAAWDADRRGEARIEGGDEKLFPREDDRGKDDRASGGEGCEVRVPDHRGVAEEIGVEPARLDAQGRLVRHPDEKPSPEGVIDAERDPERRILLDACEAADEARRRGGEQAGAERSGEQRGSALRPRDREADHDARQHGMPDHVSEKRHAPKDDERAEKPAGRSDETRSQRRGSEDIADGALRGVDTAVLVRVDAAEDESEK